MTYSYNKFAAFAKEQIDKYGGTVYLHVPVDGKVNAGTGQVTYNQLTFPAKGLVIGFSSQEVNNINVLESDKQVLIDTTEGIPLVNNTITVDGILYRILQVAEVNPGVNQPVIYKIHIRNTTLAPDLDGYFTTLKGLEIGDIVVDPNAVRGFPKWIKVANDHHAPHITTLVEQRPYYTRSYDAGEPFGGVWALSDLYEYLTGYYMSYLSVSLNELLQTVLIETNGNFSYDKISLLSKEELDGTYTGGGSSGSQIDFFDSAPRRVAVGKSSLENLPWWTRSHVSTSVAEYVDYDGTLRTGATTSTLAVRSMIFLQDAQIVKLNDDEEYEIQYQ